MHAIVSIHDVMPSTLAQVRRIIGRLSPACREHLILLVVPGLEWSQDQLDELRAWRTDGIRLAGHGWRHETREIRGVWHHLHSALISRNAAEHLCLTSDEIEQLMRANHNWFIDNDLGAPDYYVPPAWALGPIGPAALSRTPFRFLETTTSVQEIGRTGRLLPLAGFEADTRFRQLSLAVLNTFNEWMSSEKRPLRIAIHPRDFDYLLGRQLERLLARVERTVPVEALFA